jgi:hypothetical protein
MFVQLVDSRGTGVGQLELEPISRKMYRWRPDGLILEQLPLQFGADLRPGLYFVRLGFFDPASGQRLAATTPDRQPVGDEVILGPLYLSRTAPDPVRPDHPVGARLGQAIELLGYSILTSEPAGQSEIELYWQSHGPVTVDYTVFVQLLDGQDQVVAQVDGQPLAGLYPTSRWQSGEVISDRFRLAIPPQRLGAGRLVTGMYEWPSGVRLPAFTASGELWPDNLIPLRK